MTPARSKHRDRRGISRSGKLAVALGEHLLASLKERWGNYRKAFKCCQNKFSEDAVHNLRVATRRLLSEMDLLAALIKDAKLAELRCELKKRLDSFDELRDAQVQIAYVGKLLDRFPQLKALDKTLRRRERYLGKSVGKKLKGSKTGWLGKQIAWLRGELRTMLQEPAAQVHQYTILLRAVDRAYSEVVRLRRQIDPADPKTIHRTRVAFKKFRYITEALQPVLIGGEKSQLKEMRHYQAMMGDIQDIVVLRTCINKLVAKKKIQKKPLRRFREELARRRAALVKQFLDSADQLEKFKREDRRITTAP
jgi:CHAD domain-containing protein